VLLKFKIESFVSNELFIAGCALCANDTESQVF
jgi:hypothetical protein